MYRNFSRICLLLGVISVFLGTGRICWSSVGGSISGRVTDPAGALVPGAEVVAVNTQTGVSNTVRTDGAGFYSFPSLPIGVYEVRVRQKGFREFVQTGLVINANSALRVDAALQVGQETQAVTVSSTPVHVETNSTQMGEVITGKQITTIPLNGRSYIDLLALQPGVVPTSTTSIGTRAVSGNLNSGAYSVSGAREDSNGYLVNGIVTVEEQRGGTTIIPNLDSLAEFRVLTSNFDAEYGNYNGGQINLVTKSGTNQFHGDAFDFLRNTSLNARNFFSPRIGKFIQNQFGGSAGGPIIHDKAFFFGDYQGTRQIVGRDTGLIAVPSQAERNGDFSALTSKLNGSVNGPYWANTLSSELGYPVSPGQHYYTSGCTSSAQCVFPNAIVPQGAISPIAQKLMQYIPLPNVPGGFFSTSAFNQTLRDDKWGARVDGNSRFGMLSAYYFFDDSNLDNPYPSANVPGFSATNLSRQQLLSLSDTKSFGSTAVNELRIGFMRDANQLQLPSGGVGPKVSSFGFVEGPGTLGIVPLVPSIEGVPHIFLNNFSFGVANGGYNQFDTISQVSDNYSKVVGTHTLKFGGEFHYDRLVTTTSGGTRNGYFQFNGSETGIDFADFLSGAPTSYIQGTPITMHNWSYYYGLYAQDSWRAQPSLTVNYGLRWDVSTPWTELNNQFVTYVPGQQSQLFPGAPQGYVFAGDPGIPRGTYPTRYKNFAPRIGMAYAPKGQGLLGKLLGGPGKTSIRAGFGLFYTALEQFPNANETGSAPWGLFYISPLPPLFATPFVDRPTGQSEGQRYPIPPVPTNISPSNPDNSINWSQFFPISSTAGFNRANRLPYSENYMFSIERQLGQNTILALSYVGTQGHRLIADVESNPANPGLCLSLSQRSEVAPGSPTCGPLSEDNVFTRASGQIVKGTRTVFPYPIGSNGYFATTANSNYNSLEVTMRHTTGRSVLLAAYTYSKVLDNGSNAAEQVNFFDPARSKALSTFDLTHDFVFSYSYEVPFERLLPGHPRLTRGWTITGITRFATGLPVTMLENDDRSLLGTFNSGPTGQGLDVPNFMPGGALLQDTNPRDRQHYFNTSLFSKETLGQLGTSARRFFHGPGTNNFDMALLKDVNITESKALEFRLEGFNVFNHAQFGNPDGTINDGTFGLVTSANSPRIVQVAIKFLF